MGQTKEIMRDLVNEVAGHYLTDQDDGDLYDAYQILLEVEDEDDFAHNHIQVWEQLEYITVNSLIEMIQGGVQNLQTLINNLDKPAVPALIANIDWSELRNQKRTLLELIASLESTEHEKGGHLVGILHLIDAIQDYAVDDLEIINSIHVYDFDDEEDRPEY